jgi:hypothetical protein
VTDERCSQIPGFLWWLPAKLLIKENVIMRSIAGVFVAQADAERAARKLRSIGLTDKKITLLKPGTAAEVSREVESVDTEGTEQPGVAKAIGGVVGAAAGMAGGFELGTLASAFIPGVGPVVALGLWGAAILGLAGAGAGVAAGAAVEDAATEGLPADELFVYEDALRRGRTVLIALCDDDVTAASAHELLKAEGAETIDSARDQWWIGLRSAEREHYLKLNEDFDKQEKFYRLGFEASLHAKNRCKEFDQIASEMANHIEELHRQHPGAEIEDAYRRGYERGRTYYEALCAKTKAPPTP